MIISRTPFRISFAGGGSDLASYYNTDEGAVLSTTINKYIYIAIHPYFESNKIQLKYSKTELVDTVDNIQHYFAKSKLHHRAGENGGIARFIVTSSPFWRKVVVGGGLRW